MHVISGSQALLEPFLAFGFTPGMRPQRGPPVARMDQFRDMFLGAFSEPDRAPGAAQVVIIQVECDAGHRGEATPRRLCFDRRPVELVEVLDAWLAPDRRDFKMRGADGASCLLRHDEQSGLWQLTLYQAASRPAGQQEWTRSPRPQ